MGTAVPETQFRGCSQALLYNNRDRPHSPLGYKTPAAYAGTLTAPEGRNVGRDFKRRWMKVQWQVTGRKERKTANAGNQFRWKNCQLPSSVPK